MPREYRLSVNESALVTVALGVASECLGSRRTSGFHGCGLVRRSRCRSQYNSVTEQVRWP